MALQAHWDDDRDWRARLGFAARHSSYLARLIETQAETLAQLIDQGPDYAIERALTALPELPIERRLRQRKQRVALIAALADIGGVWNLEQVTQALSRFAEEAVTQALTHLIDKAVTEKMLSRAEDHGIFILGMGKLGGMELNYSSDIDLILLYEAEKLPYIGRQSAQHFTSRLASELVALMQDRTRDGYVFRTDLRLRPDPASTPLMVTTSAALRYYESVGQNWERAAMIKARLVGGDHGAGKRFLADLQPFLWRTHLDFAAVADILSIKRQMHARRDDAPDAYGHNIKTGRGGIREIEFLAQIHQLIWGGRHHGLRIRPTLAVLRQLAALGLIEQRMAQRLTRSYHLYRSVEHRLQMVADQQTHTLPANEDDMAEIAAFCRATSREGFVERLERHLARVHRYFESAFRDMVPADTGSLGGGGALVFTGVEPDRSTMDELARMGFRDTETIFAAIADWHKGHRRCTRTHRSRELLTELVPEILAALAATAEPDVAFRHFDQFLSHLPSGVQLFSLFASNRNLLTLTADLLGSAPALGERLSRHPALFDAVITGDFFDPLRDADALADELALWLGKTRDPELLLKRLHHFQQEKIFKAGVHLLKDMSDAVRVGAFLSSLADLMIAAITRQASEEFAAVHGRLPGGGLAIVGLGKLGSRELTFGSDLDLIFLYDAPEGALSDGGKPLAAAAYYNRLAQRIVGRLTALTPGGRLYDIDTRLRPFGADGPLAASLSGFTRYYGESAWIFERLALTRARILHAPEIGQNAQEALAAQLARALPEGDIRDAIRDMRARIHTARPTSNPWDIKRVPGGLVDVDFLLQYHFLKHPAMQAQLAATPWRGMVDALMAAGHIAPAFGEQLAEARTLQTALLFHLRLTGNGSFNEVQASETLKRLLAEAGGEPSLGALKERLAGLQAEVAAAVASL